MGKLKRFEIILYEPSAVYSAGTNLTGEVQLLLSSSMEMRGLCNLQSHNPHRTNKTSCATYAISTIYFVYIMLASD